MFATGTASFFFDNVFRANHSVHLSGPAWAPAPVDPLLNPSLSNARRLGITNTIELIGDFEFNEDVFFNPRGTIDGFVYFPQATGTVNVLFAIKPPGDVGLVPFYFEQIVNPGQAGARTLQWNRKGSHWPTI